MATRAPIARPAPRHAPRRSWRRDRRRSPHGAQLEAMLTVLPSLPRPALARLVQRVIDRMDDMDGDPDLDWNGDELDGSMGEDDFHPQIANWQGFPGCPVSDPPEEDCEDRCMTGDDGRAPVWVSGVRYWGYEREPD